MKRLSIWIAMVVMAVAATSCSKPAQTSTVAASEEKAAEPYRAPRADPWLEKPAEEPSPEQSAPAPAQEVPTAQAAIQMPDARPMAFAPREDTDSAPRVTIATLRELLSSGDVVVVDVRDPGSYAFEHAEGAINIPEIELQDHLDELPKNKKIVTYCT